MRLYNEWNAPNYGAPSHKPKGQKVDLIDLEARVEAFYNEYHDKERTPAVWAALEAFEGQLREANLHFGNDLMILDKIDALLSMMHDDPPPPEPAPEPEKSPAEKELTLLRERGYYAVGLPHRINSLQEPYNRTLDIVILVNTLMLREGPPPCLLVANITTETRDAEESRLIGLKDLIFYEALQDLLFEMVGPEGAKTLQRLPVVLMSDLENLPGFTEKRRAVDGLFNEKGNGTFREAVYACVPSHLRHRKHHDKTYAQLEALASDAPLKVAQGRVGYVLNQISKILSIGGKKMGHEVEKPYDEATALAASMLPPDAAACPLGFECVTLGKSLGKIPYRAAAGLKDPKEVPGLLSTYGQMENYSEALKAFIRARRVPLDQANGLLRKAEQALERAKSAVPPNPDDIANAEGYRAKLLETLRDMVVRFMMSVIEEGKRLRAPIAILEVVTMVLRDRFLYQLARHPKVEGKDHKLIEKAYMSQLNLETYLSKPSGPNIQDDVLLKRAGILKVLEGGAPPATLAETSGRWLPFTVAPPTSQSDFSYVPFAVSALMFGPNAPHENRANYAEMSERVEATGQWDTPYVVFEKAIFTEVKPSRVAETSKDIAETINRLLDEPKRARWKIFDQFLDTIEDTPIEAFYQSWLARLKEVKGPDLTPLPPEFLDSPVAAQARELLMNPCFSEHFRKDFLLILSGH